MKATQQTRFLAVLPDLQKHAIVKYTGAQNVTPTGIFV